MSQQPMADKLSETNSAAQVGSPWRMLLRLSLPFRYRILLIVFLAALSTAASLVEPLIYRVAVNDIAGLFVGKTQEQSLESSGELLDIQTPDANFRQVAYQSDQIKDQRKTTHEKPKKLHPHFNEPHRRGRVAPRTLDQTFNTFIWAVVLMFSLNVFSYFVWLIADNMSAILASKIETGFIQSVFAHVLRLPLAFFGQRASGALAKQIDQADQVSPIVNACTQTILPETMTLVGVLIIMTTQNWVLTLAALLTLPPYFLVAWRSAKRLEKGLEEYYAQWEEVSGRIQDSLSAIKTVKLSGAESHEIDKFRETSVAAYDAYIQRSRLANKFVFWEHSITHLAYASVLGIGGWLALKNELTPGDVVMFVSYVGMLYNPIDSLTSLAVEFQQYDIALWRALRLTQSEPELQTGRQLEPGPGRVEFKDVHFSYVPEREVLCGLTLMIKPGQTVGLVGPSGAGKTTTIDLLMQLYKPDSGKILIDFQDLTQLDPASVRREIGVVAADGAVFRGTLADNIRYKRPDASDEEVHAAALAAGLGSALTRLAEGLTAKVGEGGMGLSVGERQRLQLARVLVANPRIMVLDEATANLDYVTEMEVKQALAELRKGRTTIVIAHRYSMVKDADYIFVFEAGKVREAGTPEELIAMGGWFADFVRGTVAEDEIELEGGVEAGTVKDYDEETLEETGEELGEEV